jgi:hypothetical protein
MKMKTKVSRATGEKKREAGDEGIEGTDQGDGGGG